MTRIGSLFSGYGGLDMGVQAVIGGTVAWHVENAAGPAKILAHHWPDVPNYGDITKVDWATVEPVDVLTGGFPCQDVSLAGARAGLMDGTRSGLWSEFAKAISVLRPSLVVIENVRGLLSAKTLEEVDETGSDLEWAEGGVGGPAWGSGSVLNAFGRVLGDLADLGYDARWCGVRAADAGAPHGRFRVFILAHPTGWGRRWSRVAASGETESIGSPADVGFGSRTPTGSDDAAYPTNHGRARARAPRYGRSGFTNNSDRPTTPNTGCDESERWRNRGHMGSAEGSDESASRQRQRIRHTTGDSRTTVTDTNHSRRSEHGGAVTTTEEHPPLNAVATTLSNASSERGYESDNIAGQRRESTDRTGLVDEHSPRPGTTEWGVYEPAIRRWETVTGRVAPPPTLPDGRDGSHRLSAPFVEWLMGLPAGHVTDPAIGLTRNEQLKALGNGVVWQQAALALTILGAA